jgi:hypothetical protein
MSVFNAVTKENTKDYINTKDELGWTLERFNGLLESERQL